MPSKKKKYNARFPAGRIKKIMQSDEEIGKVAQAVPVIISRTLELFVESLLNKTLKITNSRNAKTLSTSHMKQCIMSEQRFDFLRELVKSIPDISVAEELSNIEDETYPDSDTPYDLSMASTSVQAILVNNDGDKMQTKLTGLKNVNTAETLDVNIDQQTFTQINSTSDMLQNYRQRKHGVPHMSISKTSTYSKELHSPLLLQSDSGDGNAITSVQTMMNPVKTLSKCPKLQLLNLEKHQLNCVQNNTKSETAIRETENTTKTFSPIPSPILNYNFNNKPVVKIDYSNISIPTEKLSPAQSLSERNIDPVEATGFNFNTQPVINIDLSNIVSSSSKTEAVATISIGNITSNMNNLVNAPRTANDTNSLNTLPTNDRPANSFFELDEDYDNI